MAPLGPRPSPSLKTLRAIRSRRGLSAPAYEIPVAYNPAYVSASAPNNAAASAGPLLGPLGTDAGYTCGCAPSRPGDHANVISVARGLDAPPPPARGQLLTAAPSTSSGVRPGPIPPAFVGAVAEARQRRGNRGGL